MDELRKLDLRAASQPVWTELDRLRAALRRILSMEGAEGMTDALFAENTLRIARETLEL